MSFEDMKRNLLNKFWEKRVQLNFVLFSFLFHAIINFEIDHETAEKEASHYRILAESMNYLGLMKIMDFIDYEKIDLYSNFFSTYGAVYMQSKKYYRCYIYSCFVFCSSAEEFNIFLNDLNTISNHVTIDGNFIRSLNFINSSFILDDNPASTEIAHNVYKSHFIKLINYLDPFCEADGKISLSGSDSHNGGKQVLFLNKMKRVYKPNDNHTATPFYLIIGLFNDFIKAKKFPTKYKDFSLVTPKCLFYKTINGQKISTFDMLNKYSENDYITDEIAAEYYYQMGFLFYISALVGATDLHNDNVLVTTQKTKLKPCIIDAESYLLSPTNLSDMNMNLWKSLIDTTEICDSLYKDKDDFYMPSNNVFKICIDETNIKQCTELWTKYINDIWDGFEHARAIMNSTEIINCIYLVVKKVNTIRIIPATTTEFRDLYDLYLIPPADNSKLSGRLELHATAIYGTLQNFLSKAPTKEDIDLLVGKLWQYYKQSYSIGDIPYYSFDLNTHQLFLNEYPLMKLPKMNDDYSVSLIKHHRLLLDMVNQTDFCDFLSSKK